METTKSKITAQLLVCLALPLFLLLLSYQAVLFFTEVTPTQENVLAFVQNKGELQAGFTPAEISHLEDVKTVMRYTDYLFYVLLACITVILTLYKKNKDFVLKLLDYGGKTTLIVILLVFLLAFFFFNEVFTLFHQLFFPQGNWLFSPDSLLIQTFPLAFFIIISRDIFLLTLGGGILFILPVYLYRYVHHHRN